MVTGLVQFTAGSAQAASTIDPVKALKAKLVRGKAVNIVSTATMDYGHNLAISSDMDGTLGFRPQGEIAADLTQTLRYSKACAAPRGR